MFPPLFVFAPHGLPFDRLRASGGAVEDERWCVFGTAVWLWVNGGAGQARAVPSALAGSGWHQRNPLSGISSPFAQSLSKGRRQCRVPMVSSGGCFLCFLFLRPAVCPSTSSGRAVVFVRCQAVFRAGGSSSARVIDPVPSPFALSLSKGRMQRRVPKHTDSPLLMAAQGLEGLFPANRQCRGVMALSPQFLDELKHRFTLSDVIGRTVKLARHGREHMGLCPFHNEKSPSFTVNDQKGFYHCFGCGAHGSVIDFVMGTQGLEFMEAVERLAGDAGMEMPRQTPEQIERDKKRGSLSDVMDAVTSWYAAQLKGQVGRTGYDYIKGRGLTDKTIERFRLGFAPAQRTALKDAMRARGIPEDQLIETGMLIKPEDGGESYDRFRNRVMFPITDRQGRVIAFGGRALDKDAKAKYLNSPETTLFHKGANLYNWANARAASYDCGQVMVVEGYMDVIALAQFGIDYAVAPLGTALTEEQISHLWQMADEPILSFDGDKAGQRAAGRAMDRALPMLKPGKSLRFVFMPEGDDPDSLVQREGKRAVEKLVDAAMPMVNMLWNALTEGVPADTPERRAGLEKLIFSKLAEIEDENVKKLYQGEFRNRLYDLFRPARRQGGAGTFKQNRPFMPGGKRDPLRAPPTGLLAQTSIGRGRGAGAVTDRMEKLIVLTLVHHPEILVRHEETVAHLNFTVPGLDAVCTALLERAALGHTLDMEGVQTYLMDKGLSETLDRIRDERALRDDWFAWPAAALSDAITGFEHIVQRFQHITAARTAYQQAEADYANDMTDENHARFVAAQEAFRALEEKEADKDGYRLESGRFSFN
ncbi:MAG: DNA primase [Alphaproteobacteria bacterium]|nr:MAG: DNA primase [Alphaproteobacteria bacterium]